MKWIQPGTEPVTWDAGERTHEAYCLQSGSLRATWSGHEPGESLLTAGDCSYLSPCLHYSIENAGADKVDLVWAITPPLSES